MDSILEIDNNRLIVGGNNLITIVNTISYQIETKYYNRTFGYTNSILRLRDGSLLIGKGNEVYREEVYQFDPSTLKILSTKNTAINIIEQSCAPKTIPFSACVSFSS